MTIRDENLQIQRLVTKKWERLCESVLGFCDRLFQKMPFPHRPPTDLIQAVPSADDNQASNCDTKSPEDDDLQTKEEYDVTITMYSWHSHRCNAEELQHQHRWTKRANATTTRKKKHHDVVVNDGDYNHTDGGHNNKIVDHVGRSTGSSSSIW
jgi:hypothetical protein